jgi:hypothetical protein
MVSYEIRTAFLLHTKKCVLSTAVECSGFEKYAIMAVVALRLALRFSEEFQWLSAFLLHHPVDSEQCIAGLDEGCVMFWGVLCYSTAGMNFLVL